MRLELRNVWVHVSMPRHHANIRSTSKLCAGHNHHHHRYVRRTQVHHHHHCSICGRTEGWLNRGTRGCVGVKGLLMVVMMTTLVDNVTPIQQACAHTSSSRGPLTFLDMPNLMPTPPPTQILIRPSWVFDGRRCVCLMVGGVCNSSHQIP
jgi:hypothetical protein